MNTAPSLRFDSPLPPRPARRHHISPNSWQNSPNVTVIRKLRTAGAIPTLGVRPQRANPR